MLKAVGETGAGMITDLVNQIIVGVVPAELELNIIVNCYKGKDNSSERGTIRN